MVFSLIESIICNVLIYLYIFRYSETRQDPKLNDFQVRTISRNYYYIDYKQLVNMIKYKMFKLRQKIESMLITEQDRGYFCPHCSQTYSLLDVSRLLDPMTGLFLCELCQNEVQMQNVSESSVVLSQEMHSK